MQNHPEFIIFKRPEKKRLKHKDWENWYLEDNIFIYRGNKYIFMLCAELTSKVTSSPRIYATVPGVIYRREKSIEDELIFKGLQVIPAREEEQENITIFLNKEYNGYKISENLIIQGKFEVRFWPRNNQNFSFK
tara:strand:- start:1867 stop:2268 length:402 start_codon:yes stop_codon:yes gene_type:complete